MNKLEGIIKELDGIIEEVYSVSPNLSLKILNVQRKFEEEYLVSDIQAEIEKNHPAYKP